MKTTIMHLMSLFLILAFSASCGKKESGSSSKSNNANNPVTVGNATGDTAYNALKGWFEGTGDVTPPNQAIFLKSTLNNSGFVATPVMCQKATGNLIDIGIPGCSAPSTCFVVISGNIMIGSVVMTGSDNRKFSSCSTSSMTLYKKSENADLRAAVYGSASLFVIPSLTVQAGSIFKVYFSSINGSTSPVASAEINTSLPSIVNPTRLPVGTSQNKLLIDFRNYNL
jgi:hypothetical protein